MEMRASGGEGQWWSGPAEAIVSRGQGQWRSV